MWELSDGRGRSSKEVIGVLNTQYGGNRNKAKLPLTIAEVTELLAPVAHIKDVTKFAATAVQAKAFRERMKAQRKLYLDQRKAARAEEAAPARTARQIFLADRRAAAAADADADADAAAAAAAANVAGAADEVAWASLGSAERAGFERREKAEKLRVETAAYIATLSGGFLNDGDEEENDDE